MSGPSFEDVLDACIADILSGHRTLAACLEEWPRHRRRLEPLLDAAAAMQRLPSVAETPPDPARRAQLMAAMRDTPQQSRRRLPFRAVTALPAALRFGAPWGALPVSGRIGVMTGTAAALAIAAVALTLVLSRDPVTAHASTLTVFAGLVERERGGVWEPLADGAQVDEGAHLRTDAEGSALLTFADGSTVGVEPNTELVIELARVDGSRRIRLRQTAGQLWHDVAPDDRPGALYVVQTPDAVVTVRGTLFETAVEEDGTEVNTTEGLVEIQAGEEQVFVAPGERASARAHRLVAARRDAREAGERLAISIDAPFVASLVAPSGKAVGVRPDGVVYRQIAGATTSNPGEGEQRIDLRRLQPGTYQLLLRRIEDGGGEVVLTIGPRELRFPVDRAGDAMRVELHVSFEDGRLEVRPANMRAADPAQIDRRERVIVTEPARQRAITILEQRARRAAEKALTCRDVAAFDPDAAAACERVVAGARQHCADVARKAELDACARAVHEAETACEDLADAARYGCTRELEALEDAAEDQLDALKDGRDRDRDGDDRDGRGRDRDQDEDADEGNRRDRDADDDRDQDEDADDRNDDGDRDRGQRDDRDRRDRDRQPANRDRGQPAGASNDATSHPNPVETNARARPERSAGE